MSPHAPLLATLLLIALPAVAQTGSLMGRVVDASTRLPVAGATVVAMSPALPFEQQVITDENGAYHVAGLPAGAYVLRFDGAGFQLEGRGSIQVRSGQTLRVDWELLPDGVTSCAMFLWSTPVVDMGSSQTGVNLGSDFLSRVPLLPR